MARSRSRQSVKRGAATLLAGGLLVGAAAPGALRVADAAAAVAGEPAAGTPVALLVGTALEGSRVLATASGGRPTVIPAADAAGPLHITLADEGRLTDVTVHDGHGRHLAGELGREGERWLNSEPLRAGEVYTVRAYAQDVVGRPVAATTVFRTSPPADRDGERLTVEFGPGPGTYGAGQIVTATLSDGIPESDPDVRARVEQALEVTSEPRVEGAWHWVDDRNLHYRPVDFWPAHTEISVRSGLDGVELGDDRYGGASEPLHLTIGDRIEAVTDSATHTMTVRRNGRVIRTIPVTTGKAGFRTRSGIKVVLRKEYKVRMRGDSVGIARGTTEFYDLPVYYATRVTWSGEYVHAAPWSVQSQGEENVSHGCTGMSTSDARWFYDTVREGDIVEVVNSGGDRMSPFDNGYGDWNVDWRTWQRGSALGTARAAHRVPGRLHPSA
ncbi:Ig-like domain-containing protein [Streptomyces sp. NPDC090022]|uniref:L,D-transpeptidase n=1 Tax=Streptomyces sp. NPDC090022 TaxID=3365920 RepID=UPI0037FE7099